MREGRVRGGMGGEGVLRRWIGRLPIAPGEGGRG